MMLRPLLVASMLTTLGVSQGAGERQLTHRPQGHVLTNVSVWSPEGQWIVYDVRTGDQFNGAWIEQVHVSTGEVRRLYAAQAGAQCGVVTYHPREARVAFILGPEHPTDEWNYAISRRRGVAVAVTEPGVVRSLDAMNYAPPFTPGALRGGSHVHVFSPDGAWLSFTYDDEVLAQLDRTTDAPPHEPNQRNVGVMVPGGPVRVAASHPRNHDGELFSVVVTRTTAAPRAGSDEINRACEEGWVGVAGYTRADGSRQERALAFQGTVVAPDGSSHAEVFVVDLPATLTEPGDGLLEGTATTRPAPPRGVQQRRLTFTSERRFPGIAALPRHWLRSSPDGTRIAFLMKDDAGVVQFWTVSPTGGEPRQLTHNATDISSAFTWNAAGTHLAHTMDGSVCVTDAGRGETTRLTARRVGPGAPLPLACVFSPDGRQIAFTREVRRDDTADSFPQIFTVDVP